MAEALLTPDELRAALKIAPRTYHKLLASGRLPYRLVGSMKRFEWSEVIKALPMGPETVTRPSSTGALDMAAFLKSAARRWHR